MTNNVDFDDYTENYNELLKKETDFFIQAKSILPGIKLISCASRFIRQQIEYLNMVAELVEILPSYNKHFVFEHNPFNPVIQLIVNNRPYNEDI